ncbi:MAG: protein translocase subunit SecD [Myxococcales bacterium]|nr:protein translocase subunit SecD [Myxococcales bacterium]
MNRGWYARFIFVVALVVSAWLALWPSLASLDPKLEPPKAISDFFSARISPGLDIKGGMRLMYEVEVDEAIRDRRDLRADQLTRELGERFGIVPEDETPTREQLAKIRERLDVKLVTDREVHLQFKSADDRGKLDHDLVSSYGDLRQLSDDAQKVVLTVRPDFLERIRETAVEQARETIANRIDALGMKEASVTAQDTNIIVEVPGATEAEFDRVREIVSKTARLEFQIVDDEAGFIAGLSDLPEGITRAAESVSAGVTKPSVSSSYLVARGEGARQKLATYVQGLIDAGKVPEDHELLVGELEGGDPENPAKQREEAWRTWYLFGRAQVTGQAIEEAFVANDPQNNKPYVAVNFNSEGASAFGDLTGRNVKRRMAIVLDDRVESAPVIQTEIGGGRCQITLGGFRPYNEILNEARDLVIVLKAGALPVPIRPANEQMIGPTLGTDGIQKGAMGAMVGVVLVLFFMLFYYQVAGIVADLMVVMNLLFLLSAMAVFGATLTLPGIAAIALNIGMAVDANVLITERIREELRNGKSTRSAIDQGFARAFWSIIDSQFTTFLAGVVLFQFGTGPIKGFAITLMLGICTSLFTGVFCSRIFFDWLAQGLRVQQLRVG